MSVIDDEGNVQVIARQSAPRIRPLATPAEVVGDEERRRRYVVCFNPREAERQRKHRAQTLTELGAELSSLRACSRVEHSKRMCELRASGRYGR